MAAPDPSTNLYLIYSGIFSLAYAMSDYTIIKNLVIINKSGIIPVTFISGFFTAPANSNVDTISTENKEVSSCL